MRDVSASTLARGSIGAEYPVTSPIGGGGHMDRPRAHRAGTNTLTRRGLLRAAAAGGTAWLAAPRLSRVAVAQVPSPPISGVVRLTHGWGGIRLEPFNAILREFEAQHPGVKVDATVVPDTDQRHQQLLVSVAGGQPPDVGMLGRVALGQFIVGHAALPLSDLMAADKLNPNTIWDRASVQGVRWRDGQVYALPAGHFASQHYLYWNKDLFRTAGLDPDRGPRTWQELADAAGRLTRRRGGTIDAIGIDIASTNRPVAENHWRAFLANNNGRILSDGGLRVMFNSKEGVDALAWMGRIMTQQVGNYSWVPQNIGVTVGDYNTAFYRGKVAMLVNGWWFTSYLAASAPSLKWGVAMVPVNQGNPPARPTVIGVSGVVYAIMRGARNAPAAWALAKYLSFSDPACRFAIALDEPTGVRACDAQGHGRPLWDVWEQAVQVSRPMPMTPVDSQIMDAMRRYQEAAMLGHMTPQNAADEAARTAQTAIDKAR